MKLAASLTDSPVKLKLLPVTKGRDVPAILSMLDKVGVQRIAENRLDEAREKFPELPAHLEKHFIGKLQSRKIPEIVRLFDVIQSVENLEQAQKISAQGKDIQIMLQVNLSGLEQRSGCSPEELPVLREAIAALPHVRLIGVMGMASLDETKVREEFALLKSLQGDLPECSMGMSSDWPIAGEEGSTRLRLGRVLFEEPLPNLPEFE